MFGEISNNWPNDLLETNVYKTLESHWSLLLTIFQWTNVTLVISLISLISITLVKEGHFHHFYL